MIDLVNCKTCGKKLKIRQSSAQITPGGDLTVWRRKGCINPDCKDGDHTHTIEVLKPKNMVIDYG